MSLRVLYSFPFRLGAGRICDTAWHQVAGASMNGTDITVSAGSIGRPFPGHVRVNKTCSLGPLRIPNRVVATSYICRLHDWLTARWLERNSADIDLVHGWPLSSLQTMKVSKRMGIPFLLERPNAHTAYAYEATAEECRAVGLTMPAGHDHQFNQKSLDHEEKEYNECTFLLCPSDFVVTTFKDRGFKSKRILRHHYGFDPEKFKVGQQNSNQDRGLAMIYVGVCEPRKGLHYALEAWLKSDAHQRGTFRICGSFVPGYAEKLKPMLDHASVQVLGHRTDIPELMRESDLFILSSVEEGSALVTYEARGAGCVILVSDGAGAPGEHMENAMIHPMRDVAALISHLNTLEHDRELLERLRDSSISRSKGLTWVSAGNCLAKIYSEAAARK